MRAQHLRDPDKLSTDKTYPICGLDVGQSSLDCLGGQGEVARSIHKDMSGHYAFILMDMLYNINMCEVAVSCEEMLVHN